MSEQKYTDEQLRKFEIIREEFKKEVAEAKKINEEDLGWPNCSGSVFSKITKKYNKLVRDVLSE